MSEDTKKNKGLTWFWGTLSAPIVKFYEKAEEHRENEEWLKMIGSITAGILIFILMVLSAVCIFALALHYFWGIFLFIGILYWGYYSIGEWLKKQEKPVDTLMTNDELLRQDAEAWYPHLRIILFTTARECALDIGAQIPLSLTEIETFMEKIIIANNCAFIQFQLYKANNKIAYPLKELDEFKSILQNTFNRLWKAGKFPQIALQTYIDPISGRPFDPVLFDQLQDCGNYYLVQMVYTTPAYIEYQRMVKLENDASPSASYNAYDKRLL